MKTEKSEAAFLAAKEILVGGVNSPARAFKAVGGNPIFFKHAQGCHLTSIDGENYIDFIGSWGPMILGHRPKVVLDAVTDALKHATSYGAPTTVETEVGLAIANAVPSVEKVRMVSSGTEAALSVARLARGYTDRPYLLKFSGCYHGHGDSFLVEAGSGATTLGVASSPGVPNEIASLTLLAQFNSLQDVAEKVSTYKDKIAAILLEPVVGNMGLVPPCEGFLQGLREICDRHDIPLVFDEVMTGFRLSLGGAQQRYGVTPDITCLGKIVGGGLPAAAYGGKKELMSCISPEGDVYQAGTLSGNPLAMASGYATIQYLQQHPEVYSQLEEHGQQIEDGLNASIARHKVAACVQRVGSMFTLFFNPHAVTNYDQAKKSDTVAYGKFFHSLLENGIYFPPSQFEAAFISSAHSQTEIETFLNVADNALKKL